MTFADFEIFKHWKMTEEPAMLIGMDVLGLLDTLIIDYRRREVQVKLPSALRRNRDVPGRQSDEVWGSCSTVRDRPGRSRGPGARCTWRRSVLDDISVTADEPRFVAPTRRDRIGRIWAPVSVNGQGPFRLVLDTGASHSALTARVVEKLGIAFDPSDTVLLRGATGSVQVPFVAVETLEFGDLLVEPRRLPIVPDALGGAEGVLGTDGLAGKRIHIDFRRDSITIMRSKNERAASGYATIPVRFLRGRLLVVDAFLGGLPVKAVIDTGGQATLGNEALRIALAERRRRQQQDAYARRRDWRDARRADGQPRLRRPRSRSARSWCAIPR